MATGGIDRFVSGLFGAALLAAGACAPPRHSPEGPRSPTTAQAQLGSLVEVVDGVYSFRHGQYANLVLVTDDGIVVVDPLNRDAAAGLAAALAELVPHLGLAAVIYSHAHADHAGGARVLLDAYGSDAPIIASTSAARQIAQQQSDAVVPPTQEVEPPWAHRYGSITLELRSVGPNHADGMLVGWLAEPGLVYAVDFLNNEAVGYRDLPGASLPGYWRAIDAVAQWPIEHAVFGHGPVGDLDAVRSQVTYWAELKAAVQEAIAAGLTSEQAEARVRLPAYRDWANYDAWFSLNVRAVYRYELDRMRQDSQQTKAIP